MKPTPIIDPPRTSRSNETVCLTNKFGLHLRAAAKLAQLAGRFNSDIQIRREIKPSTRRVCEYDRVGCSRAAGFGNNGRG